MRIINDWVKTPAIAAVLVFGVLLGTSASAQTALQPRHQAIEALMIAEFANTEGDLKLAAQKYVEAATLTNDVEVAQDAFRYALLAQSDPLARQALNVWQRNAKEITEPLLASQAAMALRERNNDEATRRFATLLARNNEEATKQAIVYLATASIDEAQTKDVLGRLIKSGAIPNTLSAWIAVGGMAQALGDSDLTELAITHLVAKFPNEPRVALLQASREREAGDIDKARATLERLKPQAAKDEMIRAAMAQEYEFMGDFAASERTFALGEQSNETYAHRASALAMADDEVGLTKLYQELAKKASDPDPQQRLLLAQIAQYQKKWDEALRWYNSVPGSDLKWTAQLSAIQVLYELQRRDEWMKQLKFMQSDQSVPDETRRDAFLLESVLMQRDKNLQGELEALNRALAAFPDDVEVMYTRALAFERRDEVDKAIAEFRKILVTDPNNIETLNALGYTLADRTTRYEEALQLINRARSARPNNPAIIDSYGWVLYKMGKLDEALVQLKRAASLQRDPEILAHVAEVLLKKGDREGAIKAYEQGKKLDTENNNRALAAVKELLDKAS